MWCVGHVWGVRGVRLPNMEAWAKYGRCARARVPKVAKAWVGARVSVYEGVGVAHGEGVVTWCECCESAMWYGHVSAWHVAGLGVRGVPRPKGSVETWNAARGGNRGGGIRKDAARWCKVRWRAPQRRRGRLGRDGGAMLGMREWRRPRRCGRSERRSQEHAAGGSESPRRRPESKERCAYVQRYGSRR